MPPDLKNRAPVKSAGRAPSGKASDIAVDLSSPFSALHEGSCFKENINTNKSEIPKLNVEPRKMKRKKKGEGYNLRKSLAWDRAFFTDEGVLDPQELSIISAASCREFPVIDEGTLAGSQLCVESHDLQKLEIYPLKELSDEDLDDDGRRDISLAKSCSSSSDTVVSASMTSRKASTQFGNKSGSRCGDCPQLLPSSSLKRPAIVNPRKATAKDLKLPKVPCFKQGVSSACASKSSILGANNVKHNQIAQPALNIKTNTGLRTSSRSIKNIQKPSIASCLRPTYKPEQNLGASSIKRHSSVNTTPLLDNQAYDSASKRIAACMTTSMPLHLSASQDQSRTRAAPFSQNAQGSCIQNQTIKPSGLRMPSPSLSFFSQAKASVPNNLSLRDAENFDVCSSQKPGNLRLLGTSIKTTKIANNITENTSNCSSSISSRPQFLIPCTAADSVLCDALNFKETGNKNRKVDYEMPRQSETCELVIVDKEATHSCARKSHLCGSGWRTLEKVSEQSNEIHRTQAENSGDEQFKQRYSSKICVWDHDANFGTHFDEATDCIEQNVLMMHGGWNDTSKPDCHEPCMGQTDELKCPCSENDKISDQNRNALKTKERPSGLVQLSQLYRSPCGEEENSDDLEPRQPSIRSSDFVSDQDSFLLKGNNFVDVVTDKLHSGEADMQDAVFFPTISDCKDKINLNSEAGGDATNSGKDFMVRDFCPRIEEILRNDEFHTNGTNMKPMIEDTCRNNLVISSPTLQEGVFDIDKQSNMLVQSPKSNMLDEHVKLPHVESVNEILSPDNDGLHFNNHLQNGKIISDESPKNYSLASILASVAGQNDAHIDTSSIKPFSDPNMSEVSKENDISICELQPISDNNAVELALAPSNKYEDDRNDKSHASFLPQNATPFSDEWLAAIEAVGEEILTRKDGAVQNSPPDKHIPEPSPWSPVKKNNQIGPFDCTKFSNNLH